MYTKKYMIGLHFFVTFFVGLFCTESHLTGRSVLARVDRD